MELKEYCEGGNKKYEKNIVDLEVYVGELIGLKSDGTLVSLKDWDFKKDKIYVDNDRVQWINQKYDNETSNISKDEIEKAKKEFEIEEKIVDLYSIEEKEKFNKVQSELENSINNSKLDEEIKKELLKAYKRVKSQLSRYIEYRENTKYVLNWITETNRDLNISIEEYDPITLKVIENIAKNNKENTYLS
ncbi:MAG: hypothetical protein ACRC28_04300, partial [Clostridium sp.]|uniref:hypothetical protein n=1 Tax=Clostridium sp. TaxID=1506 RepID=UPI003F2EDB7B